MVLTKDRIAPTISRLRAMNRFSGKRLINGVQSALVTTDDSGDSRPIGDYLSRLWLIAVRRKSKQETREIYDRLIRLLENWSESPFNLDFDLFMDSYKTSLDIHLTLLQHLLQVQAEFNRPDVVRQEVSHTRQLLNNYPTRFDKSISDKCLQEIIPSALERSERHEDIHNWREFDEIIRLIKQHLVEYFLPSSG